MVSSISASQAPAQNRVGAMDKLTQEQLAHPGYYAVSPIKGLYEVPEHSYKKKGGFFSFLGKIILTALVIGGAAIGIRKGLMKDFVVQEGKLPEGTKFGAKVKNTFAKYTDTLYDATIGKLKTKIDDYRTKKQPKQDATQTNNQAANNTTGQPAGQPSGQTQGNSANPSQPTEKK